MAVTQQPQDPNQAPRRSGTSRVIGGLGMGVADGALEFYLRRQENPNESVITSAAFAGATAAAWYFLPHLMFLKMGADFAVAGAEATTKAQKAAKARLYDNINPNFGGKFQDSEFGYTSRQRGMQAIMNSRLNARSTLANEARSLHRF